MTTIDPVDYQRFKSDLDTVLDNNLAPMGVIQELLVEARGYIGAMESRNFDFAS